jgi:hypothetical protein
VAGKAALAGFSGIALGDAASVHKSMAKAGDFRMAFCWTMPAGNSSSRIVLLVRVHQIGASSLAPLFDLLLSSAHRRSFADWRKARNDYRPDREWNLRSIVHLDRVPKSLVAQFVGVFELLTSRCSNPIFCILLPTAVCGEKSCDAFAANCSLLKNQVVRSAAAASLAARSRVPGPDTNSPKLRWLTEEIAKSVPVLCRSDCRCLESAPSADGDQLVSSRGLRNEAPAEEAHTSVTQPESKMGTRRSR